MKRLKFHQAIIAIAMMLAGWLPTLAYDFEVDGIYYNITSTDSKTVEVTHGYGSHSYSGSVVIPESVIFNNKSYRVTSIGGYAFLGDDGLTSVKIGDSVTSIGISAFSDCTGLKSIEIPNGITFINIGGFSGCDGLTEVIFNAENCTYSSNSSASVFAECKNLTKLTIGNNVKSIPNNAFDGCSSLTSVTIGNSLTSIVNDAFRGCTSLTSIQIPNSVTSIGDYAFDGCSSLSSIEIPNSVTSIGDYAFDGCKSLTSVKIPNSVTSIGEQAFDGCTSLTSIEIPNSVTSIGEQAFWGCTGLTNVVWNPVGHPDFDHSSLFNECKNITFFKFGNQVEYIPAYLCYGMSKLSSIEIPNSVTTIGDDAFGGCSGLTSVVIGKSVTSIGESAFSGCTSLTSIVVDGGNTIYDSRNGCNAIIETASNTLITGCQNTIIPNSVISIGYAAFAGCNSLTSIQIPNSVTSIGDYAFYECTSLTEIKCWATTPPTIESDTFSDYSAYLYVPAGCKAAYKNAEYWENFYIKDTLDKPITLNDNDVIVATIGENIVVKNAMVGSVVRVYTADGAMIASEFATNGDVIIEAPAKGIYIVAVDGKSFKVMVK